MRLRRTALRAYPPDEHLRSACRWGGRSKATSKAKAKARARAKARSKDCSFRELASDWGHSVRDWLAGRHREQAHSYRWIGYISKRLVGWLAAIAGKPAPTMGWGHSVRDWSAVRPPSRAGSLLQGHRGQSARGWLAGRPLSLASQLPQWVGGIRLGIGWLAGWPPSRAGSLLQMDRGQSARAWSAVRPPSLVSQLPQKSKGSTQPLLLTTQHDER